MQLSFTLIQHTLLTWAFRKGGKSLLGDLLEDFIATGLAGISVDEEERLDFGYASYDTADRDELAEMAALDGADGKRDRVARWAEVDIAGDVNSISTR